MSAERAPDDAAWQAFQRKLEGAIGIPLAHYREPQMKRRLATLMRRLKLADWPDFSRALRDDAVLEEIRHTLTINVSEFFRQPDRFEELRQVHFPALLAERPRLKLWSAGCSIGCEPYTLAILLQELSPDAHHSVLATDVDFGARSQAREGSYSPADVRSVPSALLEKYFEFDGERYLVRAALKRQVTFRHHDLLNDDYPTELDLVLCRNVVIYFTDEAKMRIHERFAASLRPGGLLFVGGSEMLAHPGDYGLVSAATGFYHKAA